MLPPAKDAGKTVVYFTRINTTLTSTCVNRLKLFFQLSECHQNVTTVDTWRCVVWCQPTNHAREPLTRYVTDAVSHWLRHNITSITSITCLSTFKRVRSVKSVHREWLEIVCRHNVSIAPCSQGSVTWAVMFRASMFSSFVWSWTFW